MLAFCSLENLFEVTLFYLAFENDAKFHLIGLVLNFHSCYYCLGLYLYFQLTFKLASFNLSVISEQGQVNNSFFSCVKKSNLYLDYSLLMDYLKYYYCCFFLNHASTCFLSKYSRVFIILRYFLSYFN